MSTTVTSMPSRRSSKLSTRRPCGNNQTKATQLEMQQPSSRTNATQLRVKKRDPPAGKDKRATSASTKDKTTTVTAKLSRKPLIAVVNHKDINNDDSKSTKAHQRNWKVAPVERPVRGIAVGKPPQPTAAARKLKTTIQRPRESIKQKGVTLKPTTSISINPPNTHEEETTHIIAVPGLASESSKTELVCEPSITAKCSNPQLCEEYVEEIFKYLMEREKQPLFIIRKGFLDHQIEVKAHHRRVLVDWLVQVQERFSLLPETLYTSIDIIDRYLQAVPVLKRKFQLVGVTSLFIAAKYEEIYPPMCMEMAYITADTFTEQHILKMERDILHTLDYQVNKPMSLTFLRRYSKLKNVCMKLHILAKYILELSFMYVNTSGFLPSMKAAAALLIAGSILSSKPTITFTGEYESADLLRVKKEMFTAFKDGHFNHRFRTIRKKYSSSRNQEVSRMSQLHKYA